MIHGERKKSLPKIVSVISKFKNKTLLSTKQENFREFVRVTATKGKVIFDEYFSSIEKLKCKLSGTLSLLKLFLHFRVGKLVLDKQMEVSGSNKSRRTKSKTNIMLSYLSKALRVFL